jgi:hypothetical protein
MSKGRKYALVGATVLSALLSLVAIPLLDADPTTAVSISAVLAAVAGALGLKKPDEAK